MALTMLFSCSLFLLFFSYGRPETLQKPSGFQHTCHQIAAAISGASQVFFPRACIIFCFPYRKLMGAQASPEYTSDIFHPSSSSSEVSACSVEPGSAEDVSKIVSHPTSMCQLFLTLISIATYPRTKPNTFCREGWSTH